MILCECGEFVEGRTFKVYIETSSNPSTATIGHRDCGFIFDFIDGNAPKKYSSKKELKVLAVRFAKKRKMDYASIERFLIEIDRIKSCGRLPDSEVLLQALEKLGGNGVSLRQ